jgi:nitrate/nitrite transport system ATP-binding protein
MAMDLDKYLSVESIGKTFATKKAEFVALTGIDLAVKKGEFVTLIGHSGCGKSTLLNLIAGLIAPSEGTILLAERHIDGPGPDRGVVFQNHSLLPWLSCFENVHLAVERVFNENKARLKERTHSALELVGLAHAEHKYPHEISGGMKQRVGIARALAIEPKVLLTRATLQEELMRIVEKTGATVLMVTHDVDEAVLLSDRVVMMTNGPAARIGEVLSVTLPRPRARLALAHDPRFMDLRAKVLEFLYEKQAGSEKPAATLKVA